MTYVSFFFVQPVISCVLHYIQGEDSDAEDYIIRPDDNLIVTAHIEDDTSSLEVYSKISSRLSIAKPIGFLVYNDREGYLYVHHDILMLNMPLCLTWFDYDANESNAGVCVRTCSSITALHW